jgi:hypothetical protein
MTARLTDRELDNVLDAWLGEGPAAVSGTALAGALERVPTTRQRRPAGGGLGNGLSRMQYVAIPLAIAASIVLALVAFTLISRPPEVGPPSTPSPDAEASETSTGSARAQVSGAVDMEVTYAFCPDPPIPPIQQFSYPGLQEYQFYEVGLGTCPDAFGYGLVLYVGPDDNVRPGEEVPTGDRVVLRFTFPRHFALTRPYTNSHLSDGGECGVTFARFTETAIEGSFDCSSVPSLADAELIDVTGEFSFDPGPNRPAQTPPPTSVELQLDGSPLPADQWQFFGCPPVTITEPDGDRVCRFSDGWHRLEIRGLFEPGPDTASIATTDDGLRVRIWWYRGEIGDSLHNGDFLSTQGECQLGFTVMTETWADGTIDCTAVPGAFSTTVGDAEQEATVDLRGSFALNPSIGAIEGF